MGRAAGVLMSVAAELRELFSDPAWCGAAVAQAAGLSTGWVIWRRHPTSGAREWWSGRYWSGERANARNYSERREAWIAAGQLPAADVEAAGVFVEPLRGQAFQVDRRGAELARVMDESEDTSRARGCSRPYGHAGPCDSREGHIGRRLDEAQGRDWKPSPEVVHLFARDQWRRRCDGAIQPPYPLHHLTNAPERATCRACLESLAYAVRARLHAVDVAPKV